MPIKVTCTNCGGVLHAPDDAAGKRGRCPTCGTVLTITEDAARVSATPSVPAATASGPLDTAARPAPAAAPRPGPPPGMTEASAGIPINPRPLGETSPASPRVPAAGQSSTGGTYSLAPPPPKAADPFVKPSRPPAPSATADSDAIASSWNRARGGLGWVQTGIVLLFLGALVCPGIELAALFGATIPPRDVGFLQVEGLSFADEIRLLGTMVPLILGFLFVLIGRFRFASAPQKSYGRGIAKAAAWATLLAFLGFTVVGVITGLVIANGSMPRFIPGQDVLMQNLMVQERIERYLAGLFVHPTDPAGQAQRFGLLIFIVFGLLAEAWFVSALGRFAGSLQSSRAAGRVSRFLIFIGGLLALAAILWLAHDLFGQDWVNGQLRPQWNNLDETTRVAIVSGVAAGIALLFTIIYYRMLGGVKRAIRETVDGVPVS